jgi:hypothetical protein
MGKRNVAKSLDWQQASHCFTHEWKHLSRAGVEEQWILIHDEVLVKREPACTLDHNRRANAIDSLSNFMHLRPELPVRRSHQTLLAMDSVFVVDFTTPVRPILHAVHGDV